MNALYAECGCVAAISNTCQTLNFLNPGAYFVSDILFSKGFIEPMAAPKTTLSSTNRNIGASKCLAFSACSDLVTTNVFEGLGCYPKLQQNTMNPTTLANQHMTLHQMHYLHTNLRACCCQSPY